MLRSTTSALVLLAAVSADARPARRTATATAAMTAATAAAGRSTTATPVTVAVYPGQGVKLARAVFVDGDGDAHDLPEAIATIDRAALAEATGLRRGYLQIVTEMGPVAYDVPIHLDDSETWPRALRGLRIRHGDAESALEIRVPLAEDADQFQMAQVAFTAEPLLDMRGINAAMGRVPLMTFPLAVQYESVGGNGPDAKFAPPPSDPLPPPPFEVDDGDLPDYIFTQPASWNVQTAWNQCVPAAYANILAYLDGTFGAAGIGFPQDNTPGVGIDGDESSLVSRMDWYTDRVNQSMCVGNGLRQCGANSSIRGIFEFLNAFDQDVKIDLTHQAGAPVYPGQCGLNGPLDRESFQEGANVTFDWICDRVQDGAGIYLNFGFYSLLPPVNGFGPQWNRGGGHSVRVFGCSAVGEQQFLHTIDDGAQDSAAGGTCVENDGLRIRVVPILENGTTNGRLLLGSTARQIDFAMAMMPNDL